MVTETIIKERTLTYTGTEVSLLNEVRIKVFCKPLRESSYEIKMVFRCSSDVASLTWAYLTQKNIYSFREVDFGVSIATPINNPSDFLEAITTLEAKDGFMAKDFAAQVRQVYSELEAVRNERNSNNRYNVTRRISEGGLGCNPNFPTFATSCFPLSPHLPQTFSEQATSSVPTFFKPEEKSPTTEPKEVLNGGQEENVILQNQNVGKMPSPT